MTAWPDSAGALFILAQLQLNQGGLDEALRTAGEVEAAAGGPVPRLELLRANILASSGRAEESERALRREIELFPRGMQAYSRLAVFLTRHGRPQEAVDVVRELVETRQDAPGYAAAVRTLSAMGDPQGARALLAVASRKFPGDTQLAALREAVPS